MEDRNADCRYYRELLGAYVTGGLKDTESDELRHHLESCPDCRREEVEVGETAGFLAGMDHPDEEPPSSDLEDRVVARVLGEDGSGDGTNRRSPLKTYLIPAAGFIVVVVAVGALFSSFFGGGTPGLGDVETIAFTGAPQGVETEGSVIAHTWGTEVTMEVSGLEAGEVYTVAVQRRDGQSVESGTFIGVGQNEMDCELNAAVMRQDASAILVTDSEGRQILRSELERRPADLYT